MSNLRPSGLGDQYVERLCFCEKMQNRTVSYPFCDFVRRATVLIFVLNHVIIQLYGLVQGPFPKVRAYTFGSNIRFIPPKTRRYLNFLSTDFRPLLQNEPRNQFFLGSLDYTKLHLQLQGEYCSRNIQEVYQELNQG